MSMNMAAVTPINAMTGEDAEETELLRASFNEATDYVRSFQWCRGIKESYFGIGVGGVIAVFLFHIDPAGEADEWLWVVTGDLPSCYLVTDRATEPLAAIETYCSVMSDWINAVRTKSSLTNVFPVAAPATIANAELLENRLTFLEKEIIPNLKRHATKK
jgi:hypothetical protein